MAGLKRRWGAKVGIGFAVAVALLVAGAFWYVNDYYHADEAALQAAADADGPADGVEVRELSGGELAFVPESPKAGIVFYPGAKVQPESYAPLLTACARQGVACVLEKPLFNLAILDSSADGVQEQLPGVEAWVAAGHSMGGVAAARYVSEHPEDFTAVAFLASYPSDDMSAYGGDALMMAGTEDGVLNRERCEQARAKLPADVREVSIQGGNHAYFGDYGEQDGDGTALITREEQQGQAAQALVDLALGSSETAAS